MDKIDLYLDFDSTLVQSISAIISMVNEDRNTNYEHIKVNQWNFGNVVPLTNEEVEKYFEDDRFFERLELFDNVVDVLEKNSKYYNYIILTKGSKLNLEKKEKWVKENLPIVDKFIGLIYNDSMDKSNVNMYENSVHIDDVTECLTTSKAKYKIMFKEKERGECSWNRNWDRATATDWVEVDRFLLAIAMKEGLYKC